MPTIAEQVEVANATMANASQVMRQAEQGLLRLREQRDFLLEMLEQHSDVRDGERPQPNTAMSIRTAYFMRFGNS